MLMCWSGRARFPGLNQMPNWARFPGRGRQIFIVATSPQLNQIPRTRSPQLRLTPQTRSPQLRLTHLGAASVVGGGQRRHLQAQARLQNMIQSSLTMKTRIAMLGSSAHLHLLDLITWSILRFLILWLMRLGCMPRPGGFPLHHSLGTWQATSMPMWSSYLAVFLLGSHLPVVFTK